MGYKYPGGYIGLGLQVIRRSGRRHPWDQRAIRVRKPYTPYASTFRYSRACNSSSRYRASWNRKGEGAESRADDRGEKRGIGVRLIPRQDPWGGPVGAQRAGPARGAADAWVGGSELASPV